MIFALVGNQNCGKTTLFNALTGSNQHVGNFPGVTVDQKMGEITDEKGCAVVDLPGIYSLRPYTQEEIVSRDFILNQKPDGMINIVDATNIERNLYLTLQLLELRIPMVLALNMMSSSLTSHNGDRTLVGSDALSCKRSLADGTAPHRQGDDKGRGGEGYAEREYCTDAQSVHHKAAVQESNAARCGTMGGVRQAMRRRAEVIRHIPLCHLAHRREHDSIGGVVENRAHNDKRGTIRQQRANKRHGDEHAHQS